MDETTDESVDKTTTPARVEVLWRPGCPYCGRLRAGLRRAGIETVEHDIWADRAAAARVREATGGDETVPTVVVGTQSLVNPSVAQVISAVRTQFPDQAEALVGAGPVPGASPWTGAGWSAVVLVFWVLLAVWQPTTSWHLAPMLLAGAWPWLIGQDLRGGDRATLPRLLAAGVAGFGIAAVTTVVLDRFDLLRGPTVLGFAHPASEGIVLAAVAVLLVVGFGVRRAMRTPVTRSAWVGSTRFATSADVVLVEGNAYFPASSIPSGTLVATSTTTICPWKGIARYYTVRVGGQDLTDAAWTYPHPLPFARRVKGRIAFWAGVETRPE